MCGIVGLISSNKIPIQGTRPVIEMMQMQRHRGPDDAGIFAFNFDNGRNNEFFYQENLVSNSDFDGIIGFNRLSIRDLSMNGHQPMSNENRDVVITFNGEIYNTNNYKSLLEEKGYKFKSNTDTEVVLNMYLEYGVDAIKKLNGMFAISIIDLRNEKIILTRDRLGIKPLYWCVQNGRFMYASEMKSFLPLDMFEAELNLDAVTEYLTFRSGRDIVLLKNVNLLQPGEILTMGFTGEINREKFWHVNDYQRPRSKFKKRSKDVCDQLDKVLQDSVNRQMVSDVKVGCQLSGGIDSTLVSYYASKSGKHFSDAVSIIFDNDKLNEERYIEQVADVLKIKSHGFKLEEEWVVENLENVVWNLESILTHPNAIGLYYLTQNAKRYVTVLLSGEGADELFGGYRQFSKGRIVSFYLKQRLIKIKKIDQYIKNKEQGFVNFAVMTEALSEEYAKKIMPGFDNKEIINKRISEFNSYTGNDFDRQIKYELSYYLPELLIRQDKMSMANSIENRVPLLDNEVIESAFSIPQSYLSKFRVRLLLQNRKISGVFSGKDILKVLCSSFMGKKFTYREKMGFGMPIKEYLISEKMQFFYISELRQSMKSRNIFDMEQVDWQMKNVKSLTKDQIDCLWRCVTLEIWMRLFIDKQGVNRAIKQ